MIVFHCKRKRPAVICLKTESRKKEKERRLLVNIAKRTGREARGPSLYEDGTAITVLPTEEGWPQLLQEHLRPHQCLQTRGGSCLLRVLFLFEETAVTGNGGRACQVVPSKATGGHAQNTHCTYAISCLCSKAEIEVSKTPKGLKNGLTAAHVAPEHVLGTVCLLTAFQAHYRAERRAFPECRVMGLRGASLRAPQMAGSVSWWQTHRLPTPVLCIHIRGKQDGLPLLAPSPRPFPGQQGEGRSTHRTRKKPKGDEF